MGPIFLEILNAGGYAAALNLIVEKLAAVAGIIKLPTIAVFVAGAILALLVGALGYKYIKLISTVCFAVAGYGIGEALFRNAQNVFSWQLPDFASKIAGVVLMLVLAFLAFKKIAYALFGVAGAAGFVAMYLFVPNYIVAAAVGVVVAMVAMYFVRWAFVIITSCAAGAVLMAILSAMVPSVGILQLSGVVGKVLAILAAIIFVSVQITSTKKEGAKKVGGGTRRVKIRRVFDAW